MEIKKCQNCGAPQSSETSDPCLFCGGVYFSNSDFDARTKEFLLLKYEFQVNNFKTAARLANEYIKSDINNIPAWGYKIVSESYVDSRLNIEKLSSSLSSFISLHLLNSSVSDVMENILLDSLQKAAQLENIDSTGSSISKFTDLAISYFPNHLYSYFKENIEFFKESKNEEFDLLNRDNLFEDAARLIVQHQVGSTSLLQRRMKLGYNRAGRLMDQLEIAGIVGPSKGASPRDVFIKSEIQLMDILQ